MIEALPGLAVTTTLLLIGTVFIPCRSPRRFRRFTTALAGIQALVAAASLGLVASSGSRHVTWTLPGTSQTATLLFDGFGALMLLLVSFIGWVICRYSIRYLDGDPRQGRFFQWTACTVGSVSLLAISDNLLLLLSALTLSSLGIHQLLLHHSHRPAARRAAWTKFSISRLGDIFLLAGLVITFVKLGTFELAEIFALAANLQSAGEPQIPATIGTLLIIGAILKTAQFPFHTWLPDTMEAPTPVSALMHAGIVNAGGYLLIRTAPLVSQAPAAMALLIVTGTLTAALGALTMLTQTSVKRQLAYSTIAQMGFMMLQCGLGAFSAAMLHLVAHSLYKAHAFLNSGNVLRDSATLAGAAPAGGGRPRLLLLTAGLATFGIFAGVVWAAGIEPAVKPGGLLLSLVFCLGITRWLWQLLLTGSPRTAASGITIAILLCLSYAVSLNAIEHLSGRLTGVQPPEFAPLFVGLISAAAFCSLFVLEVAPSNRRVAGWLNALYVHAANGFYVSTAWRRLARSASS